MKPLIYIAGPMTSDPYHGVRTAVLAADVISDAGCVPFVPQLSALHEMISPRPYAAWLAYDLDVIAHCQGLVRIPGLSAGADTEVEVAQRLGLFIHSYHGDDDLREWSHRMVYQFDDVPDACTVAI